MGGHNYRLPHLNARSIAPRHASSLDGQILPPTGFYAELAIEKQSVGTLSRKA
jgi:hypothetical protein